MTESPPANSPPSGRRDAMAGGAPWLAFLAGLVLCAVVVLLTGGLRGRPVERDAAPETQAANHLLAIEQRLLALEGRLVELERRRVDGAAAGPSAVTPSSAPVEEDPAALPWQALDRPGGPTTARAQPEPAAPTAGFNAQLEQLLEKRDREWSQLGPAPGRGGEAGSRQLLPDPLEAALAELDGAESAETEAIEEAAETRAAAARKPSEVVEAVNRLLRDIGLRRYQCVEARLPESPGTGLRDLSFVERGEGSEMGGTLEAERMFLEYFEPRRARVLLEQCYGVRSGVRVEYPFRRYEIEIPGLLDPGLVDPMLSGALWRPESELGRREVTDGMSAAHALNDALATVENVPLRLRSVERLKDAMLEGVVIDLEFDREGRPTRTIEAKRAWWELHADAAYVELWCEGGSQIIDGKRRPLFRDRFRHPVRNIQPTVWERLPAVRTIPSEQGAGDAGG